MRKMIIMSMIGCLLLISACSSSNDTFQEKIKDANDLMNETEYEDAIEILSDVEENVLPGDTYETGRMALVEDLRNEAEYMQDHITDLEEYYGTAMSLVEEAQASDERDPELYNETIRELDYAIESFDDMEQSEMYKDLTNARQDMVKELNEWVTALEDDIDDSLQSQDFTTAQNQLNDMDILSQSFPEQVSDENVIEIQEKLDEERERFVYVPDTAYKWNEPIVENEDGSIEFEGIRQTDDGIEVVISFNDYYQPLNDQIDLYPELILADGDNLSGSEVETRLLQDKAEKVYLFSQSDDHQIDDIVRFDIELPFVEEEAQPFTFDSIDQDETYEMEGVESIKKLHRPEWTIEGDDFEVMVDRLMVEDHDIEISGVIKPSEDIVLNDLSRVYLPMTKERSSRGTGIFGSSQETEYYEGTEKEFEFNYSFDKPITQYHDNMALHMFHHDVQVNLKNGEIVDNSEPIFIEDLYKDTKNTYAGYNDSDQEELITQSGKRASVDSSVLRRSAYNKYDLNERFDTFEATIDVHQDHSGVDYGTNEFTIYSLEDDKEEELYSTDIEEDHEAQDIEVDVSGVNTLIIETRADRGDEGAQHVILEEPVVEYNLTL